MRNYISIKVLKKEEYQNAWKCSYCQEYPVLGDSEKVYSEKERELARLLKEAVNAPVHSRFYWKEALDKNPEKWIFPGVDGRFADLADTDEGITTAFQRLGRISDKYHWKTGLCWEKQEEKEVFFKAAKYYCQKEKEREDKGNSRFHHSIFAIPTAALNICYSQYPDLMKAQENPEECTEEILEAFQLLFEIVMQCIRLPLRRDHTDKHPVCVERFRKHAWWVGANGITYRPIFYTALLLQSVEIMNVLAVVAQNALTATSDSWIDNSFWTEGICADGLGWGHGRQNYSNGYPVQGIITALGILGDLKGTVWETELELKWVKRFLSGISFMEYKGWLPPVMGRMCFLKDGKENAETMIRYGREISTYLKKWEQHKEEKKEEAAGKIRYFWNNDSLVKKTERDYIFFHMASNRCDGVECAQEMADKRNFFLADGACIACKDPAEYKRALGCLRMSGIPGVTARFLQNREILPETNWHGYHSQFGFAGGVAEENYGAAGFIFQKDLTRKPDASGKIRTEFSAEIGGVYAKKACFILNDTTVCLGTGITDKAPLLGKNICTEINLVERLSALCVTEEHGTRMIKEAGHIVKDFRKNIGIQQNGILYGFLAEQSTGKLVLCCEDRRTAWEELNANNREQDNEAVPIMELYIDHGKAIVNGRYCYYIYTGSRSAEEYLAKPEFNLLENSEILQAVESSDGALIEGIYYGKKELAGYALSTSRYDILLEKPVVFALREKGKSLQLLVSDPLQKAGGRYLLKIRRKGKEQWRVMAGEFPVGLECGKQLKIKVTEQ